MTTADRGVLDQCALRLPFHVNGTLDAEWQGPMRTALARSEPLRHSAAWLAALRTELRAVSARETHHASWQRIVQRIDAPAVADRLDQASTKPAGGARWIVVAMLGLGLGVAALAVAIRFA